jgi:hypothetical protein
MAQRPLIAPFVNTRILWLALPSAWVCCLALWRGAHPVQLQTSKKNLNPLLIKRLQISSLIVSTR